MRTLTFHTVVDSDVPKHLKTSDFGDLVEIYLNDPQGWTTQGQKFVRKDRGEIEIRLSMPRTLQKECQMSGLSCAILGGKQIWLNAYRWFHGAPSYKGDLENYRQQVVSHEMGHILGHEHSACTKKGAPAPIMLQQTKGVGSCVKNPHVKPA